MVVLLGHHLTPAGEQQLADARGLITGLHRWIFRGFDSASLERFLDGVQRMTDNLTDGIESRETWAAML